MTARLLFYDFYVGQLTFETSLHIGTSGVGIETDAPLIRDSVDCHYFPGTSLIGPMRARAAEVFKGQGGLIDKIFGYQRDKDGGNEGAMSRLKIEDAYPDMSGDFCTVRDGVSIDRCLGSAKYGAKFDVEITPPNISYPFLMRLEIRAGDDIDKMRGMVNYLIDEFKAGNIKVGGGKSRGLGRCKIICDVHSLDFSDIDAMARYLHTRDPKALPKSISPQPSPAVPTAVDELDINLVFQVKESPFLIKHGREDDDHDAVFTTVLDINGHEVAVVPGSSLKGVIRQRAEKILRTLGGEACTAVGEGSCAWNIKEQIEKKLFGDNDVVCVKGNSCPICRLFGNGYLASRIFFDDAFFSHSPPVRKKVFDSVAIDRFTGGAVEGKLFDAVPIISGEILVHIRVKQPTRFDRALLLFLLRDLREGFPPIRFGYGKTKGYGLLDCKGINVNEKQLEDRNYMGLFDDAPDLNNLKDWWKEKNDV